MKIFPYLTLMRPANVITAIADILAGSAISGFILIDNSSSVQYTSLLLLIISTCGLYGGGVVFNDFFDAETDKIERPERPIPSGKITKNNAAAFGSALLAIGVVTALLVSLISGLIALLVAVFAVLYDRFAKHHKALGPFVMGLCRSGNLLLGMSLIPASIPGFWYMSFVPLVFIAAITLTSQGEVFGKNKRAISIALALDIAVILFLTMIGLSGIADIWTMFPFLLAWAYANVTAKTKAIIDNNPAKIRKAVKTGILSLILLNASYAAGFGSLVFGIIVLALLPLSIFVAKRFAVT